ncbi:MAG TPA: ABC transporter substrate-binding protein [Terriglobales bacterium]|nr:ABC transporter substrate-binding protein [Terriglobales bacterium]
MIRWLAGAVALALLPVVAAAQAPAKVMRVGFVTGITPAAYIDAFRDGLRQLGWIEGQNLVFDLRTTDGGPEQLAKLGGEALERKPDVVVLTATSIHLAKVIAASAPVVFLVNEDPVRAGVVASLARPGGRATGVTSLNVELDAKRLELLKETLPGVGRVAVLTAVQDAAAAERAAAIEAAAKILGLQVRSVSVSTAEDVPRAFEAVARAQAGAVMIVGVAPLLQHQTRIVEAATKARLPLIAPWSELADGGALMTYGTNIPAMNRQAAAMTDRILRGANPADIPVERAATFELVINRRTARALRLEIPAAVMLRADRVIE